MIVRKYKDSTRRHKNFENARRYLWGEGSKTNIKKNKCLVVQIWEILQVLENWDMKNNIGKDDSIFFLYF